MSGVILIRPFYQISMWIWLFFHQMSVHVPVRVTGHLGTPVLVKHGETAEELGRRLRVALQELVDAKTQGRRHRSFVSGLKQHLGSVSR